jgi:hypothetical protein
LSLVSPNHDQEVTMIRSSSSSLLTAVQNGYWERVGERNGEAADRGEFGIRGGSDPAESAEAHEPTPVDDPFVALTGGLALADAPF